MLGEDFIEESTCERHLERRLRVQENSNTERDKEHSKWTGQLVHRNRSHVPKTKGHSSDLTSFDLIAACGPDDHTLFLTHSLRFVTHTLFSSYPSG